MLEKLNHFNSSGSGMGKVFTYVMTMMTDSLKAVVWNVFTMSQLVTPSQKGISNFII